MTTADDLIDDADLALIADDDLAEAQADTLFEVVRDPYQVPLLSEILTRDNGLVAVSTFSGCGGSSLGLHMAGFQIPYAVEFVPAAADTYRLNFPQTYVDPRDIRLIQPEDILDRLSMQPGDLDLFEGSPPCSSFSAANMRTQDHKKFGAMAVKNYSEGIKQPTDDLFDEWLRLLEGLMPKALIAENVPSLVIGEESRPFYLSILDRIKALGYHVHGGVYNAMHYGAGTWRKRLVIRGIRTDVAAAVPTPPARTAQGYSLGEILASLPVPNPADELAHSDARGYSIESEWEKLALGKSSDKYIQVVRCDPAKPLPGITAAGYGRGVANPMHPYECRKFTPTELAWAFGYPADFQWPGTPQQRYERIARSVAPPLYGKLSAGLVDPLMQHVVKTEFVEYQTSADPSLDASVFGLEPMPKPKPKGVSTAGWRKPEEDSLFDVEIPVKLRGAGKATARVREARVPEQPDALFTVEKPPYGVPPMQEILARNNGLTAVSTFSGCGGSSMGLHMAGWQIPYASEFIPAARETYEANFPDTFVDSRDIRETTAQDILEVTGLEVGELDLLEGSPPCSSFSRMNFYGSARYGAAKSKHYSDGVHQVTDDLFMEWIRLVDGLRPRALLAENVPGLLGDEAKDFWAAICQRLTDLDYVLDAGIYNAMHYGAATSRTRLILRGVRRDQDPPEQLPRPARTPHGYSLGDALATLPVEISQEELDHASFVGYAVEDGWRSLPVGVHHTWHIGLIRSSLDKPLSGITANASRRGNADATHPEQPRKWTAPEIAWCFGFPADFVLTGDPRQRYERIGRAVSPPLYEAHGRVLAELLSKGDTR